VGSQSSEKHNNTPIDKPVRLITNVTNEPRAYYTTTVFQEHQSTVSNIQIVTTAAKVMNYIILKMKSKQIECQHSCRSSGTGI